MVLPAGRRVTMLRTSAWRAAWCILPGMGRGLREGSGTLLVIGALAALFYGVLLLRNRDYLACIILVLTGLSLMRAGVELLRPSIGE
jgi:hypothetical protein